MACASRYLKNSPPETNKILSEVQVDFGRTMNQIIMEKTMDEAEKGEVSDMVPANLHLPKKPPKREVPYLGMVPIAKHDFPEAFSNFCFNSLFIKDEVIKAMVQIREECNNVHRDNRIFNVVLNGKVMRVEEFKQH